MRNKTLLFSLTIALVLVFIIFLSSARSGLTAAPRLQPNAPAGALGPILAQDPTEQPGPGPIVGGDADHDVSLPLRDIPPVTTSEPREEEAKDEIGFLLPEHPPVIDSVLQDSFPLAALAIPSPAINFDGVNNRNGVYPPDTNGDVGPNHYVQMVNLSLQIWDKSGNSLYGPVNNNTIWSGFGGPCQSRNDGDPVVLYDQLADRWLISQFTAASPYGECIAISTTGDPTGSYNRYFFQLSTSEFYDYPHFGIWPDGYYMTANRFGASFNGASLVVFDRARMLNGQSATFQEFKTSNSFGTLLASDLDGTTLPPSGSPNFIVSLGNTVLNLWKAQINWTTPSSSTFTGPTALSIAAYTQLCPSTRSCIAQPNTSVGLDGIGDRLMQRLAYRNFGSYDAMVVSHSVDADSSSAVRAAVRWYEIRNPATSPSIHQQGTYSPDTTGRWMPSIVMDKDGNIAMVYTASSSSVFPGIRYAGRLAGDPLGQMTQGEATLIAGNGSQTGTGSRWGDYANISLDPVDDCTFWFTHEYMPSTSTTGWRTRIGSFKFPSCGDTITPTPENTNTPTPTFTPPPAGTVFFDNFESDQGWVRNANGADTATTGLWERGDPEATDSNGPKQLGNTVSGSNDLVTGRLAGTSAGVHDIDGGVTTIRSPLINLPASGNLQLSFSYYLAHGSNATNADFFRVRIVSGATTTTVFERLGSAVDLDAAWTSQTVSLNSFAGQTVRILIEAADADTASLVEAAVDDVSITASDGPTATPTTTATFTPSPTSTPTFTPTSTFTPTPSATPTSTNNDLFANAAALGVSQTVSGTNVGATTETGEPLPCGAIGSTLWYRLTPSTSGSLTARTAGSNFDTVLALYSGTSLSSLTNLACNDDFGGTLQSQVSGSLVAGQTYYLQVGGYSSATGSITLQTSFSPAGGDLFFDNFETNLGWTSNPNGTDTATTGLWERGDPEATDSNGPKQLGTTVSGSNDLVTGRLAGASAGVYDIDSGVTSIRSPAITLTGGSNYTLSFSYYLAYGSNATNADFFRVKIISGGTTTTVFERLGSAVDVDAAWTSQTIDLNSFAGQTIQIVIEAADADTASLVEAGVDDVRVTR